MWYYRFMQIIGIIAVVLLVGIFIVFIKQSTNNYSKISLVGALIVSLGLIASGSGASNVIPTSLAFVFFAILIISLLAMVIFAVVGAITDPRISKEGTLPIIWNKIIPIGIAAALLLVIGLFLYLIFIVGTAFRG